MKTAKEEVKIFWNEASCGEKVYLHGTDEMDAFRNQSTTRYKLEPYIIPFADFHGTKSLRVLEIGVGLGADHQKFAESGAELYGVDLTDRAIENTRKRFELFNLRSNLSLGDAEALKFQDSFFDVVYSWGVIHHSPNTPKAVDEIYRILKDNGKAKIMIYHTYSFVGYMLWMRYGLMKLRPFRKLADIYAEQLESPGTKAYSKTEAQELFKKFKIVNMKTVLTHADLLESGSGSGQRHQGAFLSIAKSIWPSYLIRKIFPEHGLFMLIEATK